MFNLNYGKYIAEDSSIHNLNPAVKIIAMILLIITICFLDSLNELLIVALFLILLLLSSKISIIRYLKVLRFILPLLTFLFIINHFTKVPIEKTILIAGSLIIMALSSALLTFTTKSVDIARGLEKTFAFLKPLKVPVSDYAFIISLALRFIPTTIESMNKIYKSQAARGLDFKYQSVLGKIKLLPTIMLPSFSLSLKRAEDLAEVLELRYYNLYPAKTTIFDNKYSKKDIFYLFIHVILLIIGVVLWNVI